MVITSTSIAFTLLGLGLSSCGVWFFKAFKRAKTPNQDRKIGLLLTLFFSIFAIQNLLFGIGTFLFAQSAKGLYGIFLVGNINLTILTALGMYTIYYIFYPHTSPYPTMLSTGLISLSTIIITFLEQPEPFITANNSISWNVSPLLGFLTFYLLAMSIGSAFYIFTRLFFKSTSSEIKTLSLIIAILALAGVVQSFLDFIILTNASISLRTLVQDIGIGLMGIIFITVLIAIPIVRGFTRKNL